MTPEAKVKKKVVDQLKELRAYYFFPVGCMGSKFFGIECKAGKNQPTALQQKNLVEISEMGGIAVVINEDNVHEVTTKIKTYSEDVHKNGRTLLAYRGMMPKKL